MITGCSHHITARQRVLSALGIGTSMLAINLVLAAAPARAQTTSNAGDAQQSSATPPETSPSQDIVVTGQRASIQSAINIKRHASEVVDSITADDIGKLPDRSVTETLQRVAGVTIDHFIARNDPDHYSVEGSGVTIRGLTFTRSELNGRDTFSANGGRVLSFEDVPPELLAGVDVYKDPSADHIEGGIGGLVNLRTRLPFDSPGQVISVSGAGSWGDLRQKWEPSVSGLYSNHWQTGIGEIGILVDGAFSRSDTRTDGIQTEAYYPRTDLVAGKTVYVPKGFDWRTLLFARQRIGAYGALQWKPADNLEFVATFFQSRYKFHWDEDAIFSQTNAYNITPAPGTQFTYDSRGNFVSGTEVDNVASDGGMPFNDDVRSADQHSTTTDIAGTLTWRPTQRLKVMLDLQHVHAGLTGFDSTVATGVNLPSQTVNLAGGGAPSISVDQSYLDNAANYYWAFTMDELQKNKANEWAYRADTDIDLDTGGFLKSFRLGGRIANVDAVNKGSPYNWQPVSQTWQVGALPTGQGALATSSQPGSGATFTSLASLARFPLVSQLYSFAGNYFHGAANVPTKVVFPAVSQATGYPNSYDQIHQIATTLCNERIAQLEALGVPRSPTAANPSPFAYPTCPSFALTAFGDAQTNIQSEDDYAIYGLLKFGLDNQGIPLSGNIGLRWVHSNTESAGFVVDPQATTGIPPLPFNGASRPQNYKTKYDYFLPSLNLLYKLTPDVQLRFAAARAMTRPDYSQLQAYTTLSANYDQTQGTYSFTGTGVGNPLLKPITSSQLDGTIEWYSGRASSLTFDVFYKHLNNIIRNVTGPLVSSGYTFQVTEPFNVGTADVRGFEIGFNQSFDFLPGLLSGFGITSNFTFVDSSTKINTSSLVANSAAYTSALGVDTNGRVFGDLPLEGLSKYSYNLTGYYEKGILSARLAYNWRSRYLLAVNVNGTQGTDGTPLTAGGVSCDTAANAHCVTFGLPTYNDAYGQLDGSIFFKLFHNKVSIGVEAQNLLNSENRVLMQQSSGLLGRAWFVSDRRYTGSVRVTF